MPRTPRGRPQRSAQQIEDTRAHIAACALRLFQQDGYEAISMRRLAGEAGLTPMTLYKYFDSKIDILRLLWVNVFAELFDELDAIAADQPNAESRLHAVALRYVTFWLDHKDHYFMVFMSKGISQTDVSGFVQNADTQARFNLLTECLKAVLGGRVSAAELQLKAELLLCILNGIAHNLITISSYPWSAPSALVNEAIVGLTGAHLPQA